MPTFLSTSRTPILESKNTIVKALINTRQKTLALAYNNFAKVHENIITYHQHKYLLTPFKLHDIVLVHKAAFRKSHTLPDLNKFDDHWYRPYDITQLINQNTYALDLPSSFKHHNVINITFLQLYRILTKFPRQYLDLFFLPPVGPDAIASDSEANKDDDEVDNNKFEVESILDYRLIQ